MGEKIPLTLVYLGRRGGGAKITSQISQELQQSKKFELSTICIRNDNELAKEYDQSKVVALFDDLVSVRTLFKVLQYGVFPKQLLSRIQLTANSICLVPMISPLGLIVEGILKKQGITVIRLLHDLKRHPGDTWPPNILIRYLVENSKFLIALSSEVANKIKSLNPNIKVSVYPHPPFKFSKSQKTIKPSHKYVLFIGRIRKYKGIENLISSFTKLGIQDVDLVIAGAGKLRVKNVSGIKFINRWLEEWEMYDLIKNAEVVVFPYMEASQSGLLPYCLNENKKVVVTPLLGLLEQTKAFKNVFVTKDFGVSGLTDSLDSAVRAEAIPKSVNRFQSKNIEICLLESGLFSKK
jgi:glycosyltransferase involved in cell wall biosynthesis